MLMFPYWYMETSPRWKLTSGAVISWRLCRCCRITGRFWGNRRSSFTANSNISDQTITSSWNTQRAEVWRWWEITLWTIMCTNECVKQKNLLNSRPPHELTCVIKLILALFKFCCVHDIILSLMTVLKEKLIKFKWLHFPSASDCHRVTVTSDNELMMLMLLLWRMLKGLLMWLHDGTFLQ